MVNSSGRVHNLSITASIATATSRCPFNVIADTCVMLLTVAHDNMKVGSLLTSSGSLTNSSVNRSPYAYEQNPDKKR